MIVVPERREERIKDLNGGAVHAWFEDGRKRDIIFFTGVTA